MKKLITVGFLPQSYDLALLVLRVWAGFGLFVKHGLEKILHFSTMAAHFPDPVHIGSHLSLIMALISDAICSILLVLGLATRLAALYCAVIIGTAFAVVHHFKLSAPHGSEIAFLYLGVFIAIFLAGPGRFSVDGSRPKTR